ncbi:hypothetical protein HID58_044527 [Brassica napus]|uniref:Uncharacterized protein n=1 Tax=Brassica napus TaxID=3708 RepID=A0ABQ8BJR7_BRANA|nr:hypothetical protein HID58_044527 [Brassica napus]
MEAKSEVTAKMVAGVFRCGGCVRKGRIETEIVSCATEKEIEILVTVGGALSEETNSFTWRSTAFVTSRIRLLNAFTSVSITTALQKSLLFLLPSLSLSLSLSFSFYESSHNASLPQLLHDDSLCSPHNPLTLSLSLSLQPKTSTPIEPLFSLSVPPSAAAHSAGTSDKPRRVTGPAVTALRLPGVSLSGTIPNSVFGNLTRLRTLSLRLTALAGSLPLDLTTSSDLHSPVCSELDLTIPVPSLEFPARPRRRLGCGW